MRYTHAVSMAIKGNSFFHTYRIEKVRTVYVNYRIYAGLCRLRQDYVESHPFATCFPLCHETLQYPQPGDVLQKTYLSAHSAFIGESG